jgi:hypothetical protein
MGNNILLKKSSVTGKIPLTTDLQYGEIAINYADGKLYYKSNAGSVGILNPSEADNFKTIAVSGQSNVVADNPTATLTLSPSVGIDITTNAATDTVTFAHSDTSTVGNISSENGAGTVLQDISLTFDTFGHVTAASVGTANLDSRYLQVESDTLNTVTTRGATTANAITVGGITVNGNATITGDTLGIDSLTFDTTATEADGIAKVYWNNSLGVLRVGLGGGNVAVDVPKTQVAFVTNAEATTLAKGEVVYLFGAQGDRPTVKRAANDSDATSSRTFGVVVEAIAAGQTGYIITSGVCEGLALGAYAPGDILWLGSSPGTFTTTKPVAPAHGVFVGIVQRANPGNGQLYVKIQNGYELNEIHDVYINGKATNDSLFYDGALGVWKNTPPATARTNLGLGTIATQNANNVAITGGTINGTAIGGTSAAAANFTTVGTTGNVTIGGNLTVQGTTTTVSAQNLAIADNLFYLNDGSTNTNPDLGFAANYNDGVYRHAGFFRDATDGYWKVFKNYTLEPDASIYIDTGHASFALADIQAANFRGALVGNADTATVLQTARTINGVSFNGSANITISSNTTNTLTLGDGLSGGSFNGSSAVTAAVDSSIARRADVTYIGTTSVALNRTSAALALTGISSVTAPTDLTLNTGLTVTSSGNVGIKTASPQSTLAVQFVDNSTASIGLQHPNSAKLMQIGWNDTVDYTYINTFNGSRALVLQNTGGNVGIGTTTPSAQLEVIGSNASDSVQLGTIGNDHIVGGRTSGSFGIATKSTSNGNMILTANAAMYLRTGGANDRVYIASGGNVGIGTTGPTVKLHIYGADQRMQIQSTTDSASLTLGQWDTVNNRIESYTRKLFITSYTGGISLGASGSEHVHVSTQGRLGVGTTSPGAKLTVTGTEANTLALDVVANSTSNQSFGTRICAGTTANDYSLNIRNVADSASHFYVRGDGYVGVGTSTPATKLDVAGTGSFLGNIALITNATSGDYSLIQHNYGGTVKAFTGYSGGMALYGGEAGIPTGIQANGQYAIYATTALNVGMGTTSPNEKLSIGYTDNSYARIEFRSASYARQAIIEGVDDNSGGNGHMAFYTRNSGSVYERLRIASDGKVGVGITAPEAPLHILGGYDSNNPNSLVISGRESAGNVYSGVQFERSGGGTFFGIGSDARSDRDEIIIGGGFGTSTNATAFRVYTGARSGTIGTERLTILSSGNVGIGNSTPGYALTTQGRGYFFATNQDAGWGMLTLDYGNGTNSDIYAIQMKESGEINAAIGYGSYTGSSQGDLNFYINNGSSLVKAITVKSNGVDGNVGIGTLAGSPTAALHVGGSVRIIGGLYDSSNSLGTSGQVLTSTGGGIAWSSTGIAVSGSGTANKIAKWSNANALTDSIITDTGTYVGIGTGAPTSPLEIASGGNASSLWRQIYVNTTSTTGAGITLKPSGSGSIKWSIISCGQVASQGAGSLLFYRDDTDVTSGAAIITSAGNLGIANMSPSEKLDVTGNIKASGTIEAGSNISYGANQVFSSSTITTTSTLLNQVITAVSSTAYRTAKFIIQATDATGGKYQSQEILAVHNGSTVAHTEYTAINVGGAVATYDVDISGGTLRLLCTPLSSNSTVFKVQMTLIKS